MIHFEHNLGTLLRHMSSTFDIKYIIMIEWSLAAKRCHVERLEIAKDRTARGFHKATLVCSSYLCWLEYTRQR
jgi:hypothetical protein